MVMLSSVWAGLSRFFIPSSFAHGTPEARRRAEISLLLALAWIPPTAIRAFTFFVHGVGWQAYAGLLAIGLVCALPFVFRRTGSLVLFGNGVGVVWFST